MTPAASTPVDPNVIKGELVLQVPPDVASVIVVDRPAHTLSVPDMGATAGPAFTVTILDAVQPATVYSTVSRPGLIVVRLPEASIVPNAAEPAVVDHVPDGVPSL